MKRRHRRHRKISKRKTVVIIFFLVMVVSVVALVFIWNIEGSYTVPSVSPTDGLGYETYEFESFASENPSDAGILSIKDDFRFCGLDKTKTKSYFYNYSNVATDAFGNYKYALIPSTSFGNTVDTINGEIIYEFSLEGNGLFLLIRSLSLTLEYRFTADYIASLAVSYKIDDGAYNTVKTVTPETYNTILTAETSFNDILSGLSRTADKMYVKISLNHETASNVPINEVSLSLFSVKFDGAFNFVMKKGASIKMSQLVSSEFINSSLTYRAFIAKDVYDKIEELYGGITNEIILGDVIMPVDYINEYNAALIKSNIVFTNGKMYVGTYPNELNTRKYNLSSYTITVDGVEYYYYDGYTTFTNKYYTTDFMGKAYIRVLDNGGNEVFFTMAAFSNQDLDENSRSVVYCAQKLIERDECIEPKFNKLFIKKILTEYSETSYTVRKFYIDGDYNVNYFNETEYNTHINDSIVLSANDLTSDYADYITCYNGVIMDGEKVIYKNSVYDKAYPLGKTVINLYFIKQ